MRQRIWLERDGSIRMTVPVVAWTGNQGLGALSCAESALVCAVRDTAQAPCGSTWQAVAITRAGMRATGNGEMPHTNRRFGYLGADASAILSAHAGMRQSYMQAGSFPRWSAKVVEANPAECWVEIHVYAQRRRDGVAMRLSRSLVEWVAAWCPLERPGTQASPAWQEQW